MKKTLGRLYREVEVYLINLDGGRKYFAFELNGWSWEIWGITKEKWRRHSRANRINLKGIGTFWLVYLRTYYWGCLDSILGNRIIGIV